MHFEGIEIFSTLKMDRDIDFKILKDLYLYDYEKIENKTGEISIYGIIIFKTYKFEKIVIIDKKYNNFYTSYNSKYIEGIKKMFKWYGYPPYGEEFHFFVTEGEVSGTLSGFEFKL